MIDTGTQAAACGIERIDLAADRFGQAQAVAGVLHRSRRIVFLARRRVREKLLAPRDVVRKSAASENNTPARDHPDPLAFVLDDRAAHSATIDDQFLRRRGQPERDVEIERGLGQAARRARCRSSAVMPRP